MPCREHETVPIGPFRCGRIELEIFRPQDARHISHAHGHAGMPRICGLHRVHRQCANGVGHRPKAGGIDRHAIGLLNWDRADIRNDLARRGDSLRAQPLRKRDGEVKPLPCGVPAQGREDTYQQAGPRLCTHAPFLIFCGQMEGDRIRKALGRIEIALARIDRFADSATSAPPPAAVQDGAAQALRAEVAGTLRDLDALIESLEQ